MFGRHKHNWRAVSSIYNPAGNGWRWRADTMVSFVCKCGKAKTKNYKGYLPARFFQ